MFLIAIVSRLNIIEKQRGFHNSSDSSLVDSKLDQGGLHGGFQRQLRDNTTTCCSCTGIQWGSLGISPNIIMGSLVLLLLNSSDSSVLGSLVLLDKLDQSGFHKRREESRTLDDWVWDKLVLDMQVVTGNTEGREVDSHNHGGFHKERGSRGSSTCSMEISLIMV